MRRAPKEPKATARKPDWTFREGVFLPSFCGPRTFCVRERLSFQPGRATGRAVRAHRLRRAGSLQAPALRLSIKLCIEIPSATLARIALLRLYALIADHLRLPLQGHSLPRTEFAMILNRCEKLQLLTVIYDADLGPTTKVLLHRFVDMPASLLWSSERLAKSCRRSLATVERCLRELKELGIISTVRRRRQTLVKILDVQRIRALAYEGVSAAKKACAVAMSLLKRGNFLTPQVRGPMSIIGYKRADEGASWRVQGSPSSSLLRALGMRTGETRRNPSGSSV